MHGEVHRKKEINMWHIQSTNDDQEYVHIERKEKFLSEKES